MKKAYLIIVLCLPMLTGCALFDFFKKPDPPVITDKVVQIDPKLLEPCAPLVTLVIPQGASDKEPFFIDNLGQNASIYAECAKKQDASILIIKKFGNIK